MDLRDRVLSRYKTGADKDALGNEAPPMDQSGLPPVTGASELPGGGGGPGKRNIPKDHPYDPRALKPLSQMLWAMSVSLGHALTAYRKFTRLKSSTISPDGMLGGRGYVMQVKEIRDKLHDACEALSAISDTIHDEINAPHWEPKMGELDPTEALDVRKFIQESQQILQNPEEEAEEEMEAIQDSAQEGAGEMPAQPGAEMQPGAEPGEEAPEGEETEGVSPEEEEAFNQDQEGAGAAPEGEEAPKGEVPPKGEEAPEEGEEEEGDEDEAPEEEDQPLGEGEDVEEPTETEGEQPDEGDETDEDEEEFPGYEVEDDEEEEPSDEEGEEEVPPAEGDEDEEEEDNEFPTDEDEEPSDESEEDEDDEEGDDEAITPEDEALVEEALRSALPGAEEPNAKPLGKPKKKKKRMKFAPPTPEQDAKFPPEMAKMASYDRTGNSSVNPDGLGGPRVHHLDRGDAPGQFNSENPDEPTDEWALNDGRPPSDDMSFIWRAAEDNSIEQWWDGMSGADQARTATSLQLQSGDRAQWTSDDWEKVILHQASSGMPEDTDTHTDGYDFGLGYGAKGDGAGDYANPSGEGNGYQGVYGPTSGLPSEPAAKTENDSTSKIDVELNEKGAQNSLMPTDVQPPAARSDYYTEGLTDEMIAQSEVPTPEHNPYTYDRDLPNTSVMMEDHNTPYVRYDYTTPNYRPDPNYSRPER